MIIYKDIRTITLLLLMPIVIIFILGSVFHTSEDITIGNFKVALLNLEVNEQQNPNSFIVGNELENVLLEDSSLSKLVECIVVTNKEDGNKLINENKVSAFITIPEGFTDKYFSGDSNTKISIIANPNKTMTPKIAESIVEAFVSRFGIYKERASILDKEGKALSIDPSSIEAYFDESTSKYNESNSINFIKKSEKAYKVITGGMYYSISMSVFFVFFMLNVAISSIYGDKQSGLYLRLRVMGITAIKYYIGKYTAIILQIIFQVVILSAASKILFGYDWGSILNVITITLIYSAFMASLAICLTSIFESSISATTIYYCFVMLLGYLGGNFIKVDNMPEFIRDIGSFVPNAVVQSAYIKNMAGMPLNSFLPNLIYLGGIGVVIMLLTSVILAFKEKRGYRFM